ncbi:MAG: hypothetical protein BWY68_00101 [bacterium ADurb.Bin400]|nr:MAG: hypothetical protein BWY68_00101 [bacterium ADurb.Bin400]
MSYLRPIYVMFQPGITQNECDAVFSGIRAVLEAAKVSSRINILNFGAFRMDPYRHPDGKLADYRSIDWYLHQGAIHSARPNQLDASVILHCLLTEPWQQHIRHYDVAVLHSDIYADNNNFIIGVAQPSLGTVISTHRFRNLDRHTQWACVETETIHELGHVFGLIPQHRTDNVEDSLGRHCTNRCAMRQGLSVPDDWKQISLDRLRHGPFCAICQYDLRVYFRR